MLSRNDNASRRSGGSYLIGGLVALLVFGYFANQGLLIAWRPIVARAAIPSDTVRDDYFGIDSWRDELDFRLRNIAVIEGTFSRNTWLSAFLYSVQSGTIEEATAFTVGRSPNRVPSSLWEPMQITLALGDADTPEGMVTQLGSAGHTRGGGRGGEVVRRFETPNSETFPGRFAAGTDYILHIEGDRKFEVDRLMSVREFADLNDGNFLVVTVRLER